MLHVAYILLPALRVSRGATLRKRHCTTARHSATTHIPHDLRHLYNIHTPAQPSRAATLANAAAENISHYVTDRPIAHHTRVAFQQFQIWRSRPGARANLAIDAGCGCGQSTLRLARRLTDTDVVGVDRSLARLSRNVVFRRPDNAVDNAVLLRAELVDFWRLCLIQRVFPQYHFLLYPNPYPKPRHIKKRWHGHPVMPVIVALGGRLEVRASWDGYLEEFRAAYLEIAHCAPSDPVVGEVETMSLRPASDETLSNFEAKYVRVGQETYRLVLDAREQDTYVDRT